MGFDDLAASFADLKLHEEDTPDVPATDPSKYPTLPQIHDKHILAEVLLHRSVFGRPTSLFEDPIDDLHPDNERLEHLGDAVVNLCATMLIRQKYPNLRVGPATKLRALLVGNPALARHAVVYALPNRLAVTHAQQAQLRRSPAVQGDLFEAYIGGLFVEGGLQVVQDWLFELFSPFAEEGYKQIRNDHATTVGGIDVVLDPLPRPAMVTALSTSAIDTRSRTSGSSSASVRSERSSARSLSSQLSTSGYSASTPSLSSSRTASDAFSTASDTFSTASIAPSSPTGTFSSLPLLPIPPSARVKVPSPLAAPPVFAPPPPPPPAESGHLSYLNQWLTQRGKLIDWQFDERGGNKTTPLWAVKALVKNDAGVDELIGQAQAPTKKAAKNEVARQAFKYFNIS